MAAKPVLVFGSLFVLVAGLILLVVAILVPEVGNPLGRLFSGGAGDDSETLPPGSDPESGPNPGTDTPGDPAPLPDGFANLIAELDRANAARRAAICSRLGELGDPTAAGELTRLIVRDPARSVREAALAALVAINPDNLATTLTDFVDHPDEPIRQDTLRALGKLADPVALPSLLEKLADRRYQPRWLVIDAIAEMRVPGCARALADVAIDTEQPKQDRIRALGHLGRYAGQAVAQEAIEACRADTDEQIATVARALQ